MSTARRRLLLVAAMPLVSAPPSVSLADPPGQDWVRTETRDDCAAYHPRRSPLFGETHIHTSDSGDMAVARIRTDGRPWALARVGLKPER